MKKHFSKNNDFRVNGFKFNRTMTAIHDAAKAKNEIDDVTATGDNTLSLLIGDDRITLKHNDRGVVEFNFSFEDEGGYLINSSPFPSPSDFVDIVIGTYWRVKEKGCPNMEEVIENAPKIILGDLKVVALGSSKCFWHDDVVFVHEILFEHDKDGLLFTFGIRCGNSDHKCDDLPPKETVYPILNVIKEEVQNYTYQGDLDELVRRVDSHFCKDQFGYYCAMK